MGTTGIARAFIGAAAFAAAALPAFAQGEKPVVTDKDSGAVRVTSSGHVNLDYIYRGREMTAFTDSVSNNAGLSASTTSTSENTFEGFAAARLDVELSNKVAFTVEMGTKRVDGPPAGGSGIQRWGEPGAQQFKVREANLHVNEFVLPQLSVEAGVSTWSFNPRGKGGALAFDPRHSQSIRRNFDLITDIAAAEDGIAHLRIAAFSDELEPVGTALGWTEGPLHVDLVLLPAMIERGTLKEDEALYALDLLWALDSLGAGSRIGIIGGISTTPTNTVGVAANNNEHAKIYTVGGGGTLSFFDKALEFYGEGYFQRGKVGQNDQVALGGGDIQARGFTYQVGLEWHHVVGNPMPIWAGFNHFYVSGEKKDNSGGRTAGRFSGYESVNDLMIVEDQYFGFDWDSNITGFKISGGTKFSAAQKDDLEVSFIYGHLRTPQQVAADRHRHGLGEEVDLKANWSINKQFVLKAAIAVLWNSELLKTAMETDPVTDITTPGSNPRAERHTLLYTLGFDLTF